MRKLAVEHRLIPAAVVVHGYVNKLIASLEGDPGRFPYQVVLLRANDRRRKLDLEFALAFHEINRPYAQRQLVIKESVRREGYILTPIGHAIPVGVPLAGKLFAA